MTFSIFDFIIFTIIIASSLLGIYRGFIYISINLIGLICSIILAFLMYSTAKDIYSTYISNELGLSVVSSTTVYIISLIICTFITTKIISLVDGSDKSFYNRFLGLLVGVLRGVFFVTLIFVVTVLITSQSDESQNEEELLNFKTVENYPKWLVDSECTIYLQKASKLIMSIIPKDIIKSFKQLNSPKGQSNDIDAISAINVRKKKDVKSIIEIPASPDLTNSIDEVLP